MHSVKIRNQELTRKNQKNTSVGAAKNMEDLNVGSLDL